MPCRPIRTTTASPSCCGSRAAWRSSRTARSCVRAKRRPINPCRADATRSCTPVRCFATSAGATRAGTRSRCGLATRGLTVVTTGGADPQERAYLDALWAGASVERLDGMLDWRQLTALLRGAALYVGADTSVTHLAAAAGCPTVALFGPTDPRLWGPWPSDGLYEMWHAAGSLQQRGNVWLVQHAHPCTPCQKEGCERHLDSRFGLPRRPDGGGRAGGGRSGLGRRYARSSETRLRYSA